MNQQTRKRDERCESRDHQRICGSDDRSTCRHCSNAGDHKQRPKHLLVELRGNDPARRAH